MKRVRENDIFDEMVEKWPSSIVERSQVKEFSGGLVSPGSLANADSLGTGPAVRIKYGSRKVCYPSISLADWFRNGSTVINRKGCQNDR